MQVFSVLQGSFVNGLSILLGGLCGLVFQQIPAKVKETVMTVLGIGILGLGIQMLLSGASFVLVIVCVSLGAVLGELWKLEERLERFGSRMERKFDQAEGEFSAGFVSATLLFVVGSMGVIGAIESGMAGDHATLYTKATMDGITALLLASTLGVGVLFSAIPVVLYQGAIALVAHLFLQTLPTELVDPLLQAITTVGGVLLIGISLNLLELKQVRVTNVLPALILVVLIVGIQFYV